MSNIVIAGSRSFDNYDLLSKVVKQVLTRENITNPIIISGGARGADELNEYCINCEEYEEEDEEDDFDDISILLEEEESELDAYLSDMSDVHEDVDDDNLPF